MRPNLKPIFVFMPVAVAVAVIAVLWCRPVTPAKDVVATVNKEPIFQNDLKREITLRAKLNPGFSITPESERDQLEAIIDRKLIVQEAMRKGLARDERFVRAMQTVWEQTLIRDFLNYKKKEFVDYLAVTDEEIRNYYDNMKLRPTFRVFRTRDEGRFRSEQKKYAASKGTAGWQILGPVSYEDVASRVLAEAFALAKGQVKFFTDDSGFYLIEMTDQTAFDPGPLDSLRPEIEKRVLLAKEKKLFEDWLKDRKQGSRIWIRSRATGA